MNSVLIQEGTVKKLLLSVSMALALLAGFAHAEMYRWVDGHGVITFKDYPPPASQKRKVKVKVYSDDNFNPAPPAPSSPPASSGKRPEAVSRPAPAKKEQFNGTVEIYVTDWCGYCKKAIAYMKNRNIPYVAYDIEKDSGARQRHADLGGGGVPLIIIGNHKMSGFSAETLEHHLRNR